VGQPLGPALCQPRLLSGAAHHGARHGEGRPAERRERRLHARHRAGQRHGQARHRRGHAARPQARLRPLLVIMALWDRGPPGPLHDHERTWRSAVPKTMRRRALLVAVSFAPSLARAQSWPSQPLKIVVPYPPGGLTDVLGRLSAERLQAAFGQPVIVDNKPGAATQLGASYVAKQPPDGYTLLLATVSTLC